MILVRAERARDLQAIDGVVRAAFGTGAEAALVKALRERARPLVSLVAEAAGEVVGHVMLSPARLDGLHGCLMALAPLAVTPARQRAGIGTRLVHAALARCRALGCTGLVVLGEAHYYRRFGFRAASECGIDCPYPAPPGAFQVLDLVPGALSGVRGTVRYHAAFDALEAGAGPAGPAPRAPEGGTE